MSGWLRISIMVVVSEIALAMIGGGFDAEGMMFAGGFILVLATLPLIVIISLFHLVERWLGRAGTIFIALVGLLPTAFIFAAEPLLGVEANFNAYALTISVAGLLWSVAWLVTRPHPPRFGEVAARSADGGGRRA